MFSNPAPYNPPAAHWASLIDDLRQGLSSTGEAGAALEAAWEYVQWLERQNAEIMRDDAERRADLAVAALDDSFDPRGHYVYILYSADGVVKYVGRSSNVLARVGTHFRDEAKKDHICRVGFIRCPGYRESMALEMDLIRTLRPALNIVGVHPIAVAS